MKLTPNGDPSLHGKYFYSAELLEANENAMSNLSTLRILLEKHGFLRDHEISDWNRNLETAGEKTSRSFATVRALARKEKHPRFTAIDNIADLSHRLKNTVHSGEYSRSLRLASLVSELNYFWLCDDFSWDTAPGKS